uniref:Eukaryotic translation initiation factor 4E binding protein 1 n=1 Tax=Ciona intestinalis TaxID=7719 RepID=H2XKN7_CIOIN
MSESKGIPIRHIRLNHLSELPNDYGTTPGGTFYSTTPGGTRIIYDRSFLLKCRSSPMANTPPSNLPDIPGVTSPDKSPTRQITKIKEEEEIANKDGSNGKENGDSHKDEEQFDLEI